MSVNVRPPEEGAEKRVANAINGLVIWIARHWLAILNTIVAVFVLLPFLAPVLMRVGATTPASLIYKVYAPACHQLPERSLFLFGRERFYSVRELEDDHALPPGLNIFERQQLRWAGSLEAGWKVAICQRDIAIYGGILVGGLLFAVLRPRLRPKGNWPKMPIWLFLLCVLPVAVDGMTQLFGLRESIPALRFFTGALLGVATAWFAYPYVDDAMRDIVKQSHPTANPAGAGGSRTLC